MVVIYYVLGRLAQMVPVLLIISVIAFLVIQLVPGDPIKIMLGGRATEEMVQAAHERFGLDDPLHVQFGRFLWDALHGDLGVSIIQKSPVTPIILERLGPSLSLLVYSSVLAVAFTVPLAIMAALRRDTALDHAIRSFGMVGFAMPPFWTGLLLMLLLGIILPWFPIAGAGEGLWGRLRHLFLPSLTIAIFLAPILIQSLRAAMINVMQSDYVEVARAKGLNWRRIMVKHVLRNALIPVITILSINIGWLLSSMVIVEYVFSIPGLGSLLVRAVGYRDYPVIQGLTITFGAIVVIVNLLADLAYMAADRRVLEK